MKIGDYVRTKSGSIFKIFGGNEDNWDIDIEYSKLEYIEDNWLELYRYNDNHSFFNDKNIIKSSPNILDILEPMDLLYIDISPDDCGGIVVPRIPETLDELERYIEKIKSGEYILKYVVTHEQLENNMYEVGE